MTIKSKMDLVYSARFLNLLRKPFKDWEAYKQGIIDDKGNVIKRKTSNDWTKFHQLVANIKKLLRADSANKLATLYLAYKTIREEYNIEIDDELIQEFPIFEEMVSGDAGGDAGNIAAGTNSGAAVYPGPKTLNKKKSKRKMNEVTNFKQFIEDRASARITEAQEEKERNEKMNEVHTYKFKAFGANSAIIEASEVEVKTVELGGSTAHKAINVDELSEAFKELGVDGALTYMKTATKLVWKQI